jgi:uncharacterized protein (TIGR00369 family)
MFKPQDPHFAERVAASFQRQTVMATLGAQLRHVTPGAVEIALPYRADLCQQHGFMHAGMLTTVVDSACGYAALSLMPPAVGVLTVEFKVNFFAPAAGEQFIVRGKALGSVLIVGGVCYLVDMLAAFLVPDVGQQIDAFLAIPPTIAEVWTLGYLLVKGVMVHGQDTSTLRAEQTSRILGEEFR